MCLLAWSSCSLDTTKGMFAVGGSERTVADGSGLYASVMSGLITGPYFLNYFNKLQAFELGTMVAVLEIGAFCTYLSLKIKRSYSRFRSADVDFIRLL